MGKNNRKTSWNKLGQRSREGMEQHRRKSREQKQTILRGTMTHEKKTDRNTAKTGAEKQDEGKGALMYLRGVERRN